MPDRPKHRFSAYIHVILGIFLGFLALLPLWYESIRAERVEVMTNEWLGAWLWAAFVAVSFWYSWRRCSSEALNYYDGLLLTAAYMITGWMLFSFFFVFPALLVVFVLSLLFSLWGDVRRNKQYAPSKFQRLIMFIYRHRMRR